VKNVAFVMILALYCYALCGYCSYCWNTCNSPWIRVTWQACEKVSAMWHYSARTTVTLNVKVMYTTNMWLP